MARAELVRGSVADLMPHLEKHRRRKDLLLIIPEEETPAAGTEPLPEEATEARHPITIHDGIPLLPTQGAKQRVTLALVKQLADEAWGLPGGPARSQPGIGLMGGGDVYS
jgi:hypothetical protein